MNYLAWVVAFAVLIVAAKAHGADDMVQKTMIEPAGLIGLIAKYPLAFVQVICSFIGACVVSAYQKKDRLKQVLINTSVSIILTPLVFTLFTIDPTLPNWAGVALGLGLFSGIGLKLLIDPDIHAAIKDGVIHQIHDKLGGDESEEKAE